jgi:phage baseplate assembly protein gpV
MGQELDLLGLLHGRVSTLEDELDECQQRAYGLTLGEVTDLDDPKFIGRVKVKFPWLSTQVESAWARIATAWAGGTRGTYLLPEVGDEVVVAFLHGNLKYPYILGFLWSDEDRPPETTPRLERRELRSKSGHRIVFDDLSAMESLTLESQGGHKIVLDDSAAAREIKIEDSSKNLSIVLDTDSGNISVSSKLGNLDISAPVGSISLGAANIDIRAKGTLQLKGESSVVVTGGTVRLN